MEDNRAVELIVKHLPFWDKLNENEKNKIYNNSAVKEFKAGDMILNSELNCIGLLIIKSGQLRIYIVSEDGREITLYRLSSGELCVLSASCVINTINFDVNVDVVEDSEVVIVNSRAFSDVCKSNIYMDNFSNKIIADRFSKVMWVMEQIMFMKFDKRLALFLIEETEKSGSDTLKFTHEQIAKFTSSAREVVSRMLKYFEKEGIIELSRGRIKIKDRDRLLEYTE